MPKLNVVLRKEDLDPALLAGKVVVVIDVLFATSSIATALHQGAESVIPFADVDQARAAAEELAPGSYLLAGEHLLHEIPGFAGYSPLALAEHHLRGRTLLYSTTNGTRALDRARTADAVYAAALLNAPAILRQLDQHVQQTLILLCAGSAGRINLEDLFAASLLVEGLTKRWPGNWSLSDTARIAHAAHARYIDSPLTCLLDSQLGQLLATRDMHPELRHAAQIGLLDVVPRLVGDRLVCLKEEQTLPVSE